MKKTTQLMGAVSATALVAFTSAPVLAAGTDAGDTITNNVTVGYSVGGVAQADETASDTFTVDRKIDVTVAELGGSSTSVAPDQDNAAITFTVTNLSNDTADFDLSVVQSAADDFDITGVEFYIDDGDGIFNAADGSAVTFIDELAEDASVVIHVVGDIPDTVTNGQSADVALVADTHEAGGVGSLGTEYTATAGANTAGVDNVLADGAGDEDGANDGAFSDTDSFVVSAADLTITKSSTIISDPVNSTTNPKAIPGAVIQYCITVANAAGVGTATNVDVSDTLPGEVSFVSAFGIYVDGDAACTGGTEGVGSGDAAYNAGTGEVTGDLSDIPASTTRSLYFRVTID